MDRTLAESMNRFVKRGEAMMLLRCTTVFVMLHAAMSVIMGGETDDSENKTTKTWTLNELRKLATVYNSPIKDNLTTVQREAAQKEKTSTLPVGQGFSLRGNICEVERASSSQLRSRDKEPTYLITVVYESPQKLQYEQAEALGGFAVRTVKVVRPVEKIELRVRTSDASVLDVKMGQSVDVTGMIKKIEVHGEVRRRKYYHIEIDSEDARIVVAGTKRK